MTNTFGMLSRLILFNLRSVCQRVKAINDCFLMFYSIYFTDLDDVTIQLFKQSNNRTFGNLTKVS